jgi:hypothetical protein
MLTGYPSSLTQQRLFSFMTGKKLGGVARIFGPDYYHMTVRGWQGVVYPLPEVVDWLREHKDWFHSVHCSPKGWEILGPKKALCLILDCPGLQSIFSRLNKDWEKFGIPYYSWSSFKPHISVAEGVSEVPEDLPLFVIEIAGFVLVNKSDDLFWSSQ